MIHRGMVAQQDDLRLIEHTLPLQTIYKASELNVHIADYIQDCLFEKELIPAADQLILGFVFTPVRRLLGWLDLDEFRRSPGASDGMPRIVALGEENVGHIGIIAFEYLQR